MGSIDSKLVLKFKVSLKSLGSLPALILALALFSSPVMAGISSADDAVFGPDSLTFDSDTNLAWLDLTHTINRSYDDVASKLGAGQEFDGYRYATEAEVLTFLTNAGIPDVPGTSTSNVAPITNFQLLTGSDGSGLAIGFTATTAGATTNVTVYTYLTGGNGQVASSTGTRSSASGNRGSWLVKTVMPVLLEPADDPVFGPNSLTLDTTTNLLWLDLEYTDGRSFSDVSSQLSEGGELIWETLETVQHPFGGCLPFMIDWNDTPHPSATIQPAVSFSSFKVTHPQAMQLQEIYQSLGLDIEPHIGDSRLELALDTPRGRIQFTGTGSMPWIQITRNGVFT